MISATPEHGTPNLGPPTTTPDEVESLEKLLRDGAGWMSASAILISRYITPTEGAKRLLRATASECLWIISGQHGYKHLQYATPEEVKHSAAQIRSQTRKMYNRATAVEENYRKIYQNT